MAQHLHSWMFAADGKWEEALVVNATKPIDIEHVRSWVLSQPQNVAFEAEFAVSVGEPSTMFGVRLTDLPKSEQVGRIAALLMRTAEITTEADFARIYDKIFPDLPMFGRKPDALNIGVVGQWFSVGEHPVWAPETPTISYDELLKIAPRFAEHRQNPTAIEAWYVTPMNHWYKIYVSEGSSLKSINRQKYDAAIIEFNKRFLCL